MTDWIGLTVVLIILLSAGIVIVRQKKSIDFYKIQEKELDQYSVEVETIYRQMRGIRHDYRNHLQVMHTLMNDHRLDELDAYIKQLTNELNQVDTIIQTGNTMIDAIVNTKLTAAKHKGISLYATAIAPNELGVEHVDLAIILGNLLTNAIEATEKESNSADERFIRLYIAPMKNTLYINVTNTMTENPKPSLFSLKSINRRGYGLYRIDQAVERYQGMVNRKWEDGVFATEVTLPLKNRS